jgi:hypothetical protein
MPPVEDESQTFPHATIRFRKVVARLALLFSLFLAWQAHAEPYLAVQMGLKCSQCHVNPTGGGERTVFGELFAQTQLAAKRITTGTPADTWTGEINKFLSVGGDLRYDGVYQQVPHTLSSNDFELEQARVYLSANLIPNRLLVYVDELVAPGGATNEEAYGLYWSANHDWYVKAGQMYLPFGLRLQDQDAYVQGITGINMELPDQGVEFGFEHGQWDAQFTVSNGTSAGPETDHGKQYGGNVVYVMNRWRLGLAANLNSRAVGDRTALGVFGGLRTGPIEWLAQVDTTEDKSVLASTVNGGRRALASLLEANWGFAKGNNLKITAEFQDLDRDVSHDAQTKWSIVYELSPIQFMQLRTGFRYFDGLVGAPDAHMNQAFVEFHGFF